MRSSIRCGILGVLDLTHTLRRLGAIVGFRLHGLPCHVVGGSTSCLSVTGACWPAFFADDEIEVTPCCVRESGQIGSCNARPHVRSIFKRGS